MATYNLTLEDNSHLLMEDGVSALLVEEIAPTVTTVCPTVGLNSIVVCGAC